jgi:hypothetical protein
LAALIRAAFFDVRVARAEPAEWTVAEQCGRIGGHSGTGGDQPFVAAAVQEWGAGRALPGDADVATIREAARDVLADGSYRPHARERAARLADVDGISRTCGYRVTRRETELGQRFF